MKYVIVDFENFYYSSGANLIERQVDLFSILALEYTFIFVVCKRHVENLMLNMPRTIISKIQVFRISSPSIEKSSLSVDDYFIYYLYYFLRTNKAADISKLGLNYPKKLNKTKVTILTNDRFDNNRKLFTRFSQENGFIEYNNTRIIADPFIFDESWKLIYDDLNKFERYGFGEVDTLMLLSKLEFLIFCLNRMQIDFTEMSKFKAKIKNLSEDDVEYYDNQLSKFYKENAKYIHKFLNL